jgi:hypothetical protein
VAAALLSRALDIVENGDDLGKFEQPFNNEYADVIPSDSSLVSRFEKRLKSSPSDFSPLRPQYGG